MSTKNQRRRRADAERNRAAILSAAELLLGTEGPTLSTEVVARHASVGIATVFRHFPTKEALLRAVVTSRVERLTLHAREPSADEGEALFRFFDRVVEHTASTPAIHHALSAIGVDPQAAVAEARTAFLAALDDLLSRAQKQGVVRDDVDLADVYELLVAVLHMTKRQGPTPGGGRHRTFTVVLDGLRAPPRGRHEPGHLGPTSLRANHHGEGD